MRPEVEQELAHTLLVELLAYQFASPVRWIETQDVFLAEKTAERVVEIGPADTLGVMAKRTLASKYEAYDAAKSVQRQILCYNKDAKDIYYEADPVEDEPEPAAPSAPAAAAAAPAAGAPAAAPAAAPAPSAGPAAQVPDAPVQAIDIVRSLIAQKLKKPLSEVPLSKAIKDLVGGKFPPQHDFGSKPEADVSQASPLSRTRSSVISERSLARPPRSPKIPPSTSSVPLCRPHSTASLESSRSLSSPV
jgi:fatty acid synthase subunit alpha, fungi type